MASAKVREELCCSLCLDIYSDPICLSCGHHFCKNCIENVFERQKLDRIYTCPECRTIFKRKPELTKSRKLCNIVEHLFSDKGKDGAILCTYCIGFSSHAVKRCLLCEAFLCEDHLKVHSRAKEHVLTETNSSVLMDSDRQCTTHNEPLEYYCSEDEVFLCASCHRLGSHSMHKTETLSKSYTQKMHKLKNVLDNILSTRRSAGEKIHEIKGQVKQIQEKSTGIRVHIVNLFVDIKKQVDELENQVLGEISRQRDDVVRQLCQRIQQLEIQKDELYQKILHIEELFGVNDTVSFLKECRLLLYNFPDYENNMKMEHSVTEDAKPKLDDVLLSVTLESSLIHLANSIAKVKVNRFHIEGDSAIVMDCNTSNNKVVLSSDFKMASYLKSEIIEHIVPERFSFSQVLSAASFKSGEHYLEIQVSTTGYWIVGMAYPTIEKTGNSSLIGCNNKSWGLAMLNNQLSALHNTHRISVHVNGPLHVIGIYLNYEAGLLSFYQISSPIRHLHTFSSNFSEPLYPAFYVCGNSWVRIKN